MYIVIDVAIDSPRNLISLAGLAVFIIIFFITSTNPSKVCKAKTTLNIKKTSFGLVGEGKVWISLNWLNPFQANEFPCPFKLDESISISRNVLFNFI